MALIAEIPVMAKLAVSSDHRSKTTPQATSRMRRSRPRSTDALLHTTGI